MDEQRMYGSIHTHMQSRFDTADNIPRFVEKLGEYGAAGFVLTDHGVLSAVDDVDKAVKEYNEKNGTSIKFIPGVEAYVEEDDDLFPRKHLILIAKDNTGYKAICRAVSESNRRLDSLDTPRMDKKMLEKHFGPDSAGHGHVFATSACVGGIIATLLRGNELLEIKIGNFKNAQKTSDKVMNPGSSDYKKYSDMLEKLTKQRDDLTVFQKDTKAKADKKYAQREKQVEKLRLSGDESYESARKALDEEEYESEVAKKALDKIKAQLTEFGKKIKETKDALKKMESKVERYNLLQKRIDMLSEQIKSEGELLETAEEEARYYNTLFGSGFFFIELQNHGIENEGRVMPVLADIAKKNGFPVIASNDIHTITNSDDDILARQIIRAKRFNQFEPAEPWDRELYIKTDKELRQALKCVIADDAVINEAMDNIRVVIDSCSVTFKKEPHYPKFACENRMTADEQLRKFAKDGIEWRFPGRNGWTKQYEDQLNYELDVIRQMGVSDYLLIVKDFLEYGRIIGKVPAERLPEVPLTIPEARRWVKTNGWETGEGVGPGRGSAVGSLVCYLTGITNLDPLKYGLLFGRFLNLERVSMPDIDSDFRSDVREKVIEFVKHKYGEDAVCCILTKGKSKAKNSIRDCARFLGQYKYKDPGTLSALAGDICRLIPNDLNISLSKCEDMLMDAFADDKDAKEIIRWAKLEEGCFTNYGMHAAGVIIADNGDVGEYTPLRYNTKKHRWTTQCDMVQSEEKGLLKMDFLGLKMLDIITDIEKLIEKRTGTVIETTDLPFEKEVFQNIFAKGKTNGVFQFESSGMKDTLKQLKPDCYEDLIMLVALYRPGPMDFIPEVVKGKNKRKRSA